jgi:ABC-type transport system substrate-binding protein
MAYTDTSRQTQRLQDDLNSVYNKLAKNRSEYETKLAEARTSLFELANANEPTLGPWKYASSIEESFENKANFGTPFGDPWFDNVRYITYPGEAAAVRALESDEVDIILEPEGLSPSAVSQLGNNPEIMLNRNMTRSARFLVFNHANPYLADPAIHRALACMIDPQALAKNLGGDVASLPGFVLDDFWRNEKVLLPCAGASDNARLTEAFRLLTEAGYTWSKGPSSGANGSELKDSKGNVLPRFTLLTPQQDLMRNATAEYIAQQAEIMGLTLDVQISNSDDLLYAVYGSRDYDMALLGWRLSVYPSYLCEWFVSAEQNPFAYNGSNLTSACEAWNQANDLETAKLHAFEVQSILMQDLPLVPLYVSVQYDAYRNVRYPFSEVIDGLTGLYGAPALAKPIP